MIRTRGKDNFTEGFEASDGMGRVLQEECYSNESGIVCSGKAR